MQYACPLLKILLINKSYHSNQPADNFNHHDQSCGYHVYIEQNKHDKWLFK